MYTLGLILVNTLKTIGIIMAITYINRYIDRWVAIGKGIEVNLGHNQSKW